MKRTDNPIRALLALIAVGAFGILPVVAAHAADPGFADPVISDSKDGDDKEVFPPNTPKIYLTAGVKGIPVGTKITSKWIAEKIKLALPDYEIDSVDMTVASVMNHATFSLGKPNVAWPVGDYRVELLIDGKLAETIRFKIAR